MPFSTAFDYSKMVAAAIKLIAKFGRQVTFFRFSTTPNDPTKPWRAEDVTQDQSITGIWAALVPWQSDDDKDSVRYGVKMVYVAAPSFPDDDGELFDGMIDADGGVWHLHDANVINPGGTRVLYTFRAEQ